MAIYYGKDPKNSVPTAVLYWRGPGYYAGEVIGTTYYIYFVHGEKMSSDASRIARSSGLGCLHWAETPEDALCPYEIRGKKE
jgi:hypothetical protein